MHRRDFLGALALSTLLNRSGSAAPLHHPPKAKRVVQLFMAGGASHNYLFFFLTVAVAYLALSIVSARIFEVIERHVGRHERVHG